MTPQKLHTLRLNGRVPAGLILVSMCGKMREPYVAYTKLDDDWRMMHGLQVCVVTREDGISDETFDFLSVLMSVNVADLWLLNLNYMTAMDVWSLREQRAPTVVPIKDRDDLEDTLDWMWWLGMPRTQHG